MKPKSRRNLIVAAVLVVNVLLLAAVLMILLAPAERPETDIKVPLVVSSAAKSRSWRKVDTIPVSSKSARSLAVRSDGILLVGDDAGITAYQMNGKKSSSISLTGGITALAADKGVVYAATPRQIIKISLDRTDKWPEFDTRTRITAIAISTGSADVPSATGTGSTDVSSAIGTGSADASSATGTGSADVSSALFIADAGHRKVYCYSLDGKKLWETSGAGGEKFIVPSPYFDLAPDGSGGVWVVNPGLHRVENYTAKGEFKALWEPVPGKTMLGCCNPAYIGVLSGDRFVTLEKGLVRSRVFAPSGKVIDYVASERDFSQGAFRYDLAVLPDGKVVILDGPGGKIDIYAEIPAKDKKK